MESFKNKLATTLFGMTRLQAQQDGICICCKKPLNLHAMQEIEFKEYQISAFGDCCFPKEDARA
jgi:hypothetical protein